MALDQGTFFYWSEEFIEMANELDIKTLEELRKVAYRLSIDPDLNFEERIRQFSEKASGVWLGSAETWIESSAASAYLRGIQMEDKELFDMLSDPKNEENPLPRPRFSRHARTPGSVSEQARAILRKYENHWDHYGRYENTFKEEMRRIRLPFRNSSVQAYRDIAALTQKADFMDADTITRREMAQSVLNEFADRGINVVQFPSRHKMSIEAFAHRESRAYLQHIAVEGQINRAVERGYDLVRINSYAGASPMCAPHQGNVFSLTGSSEKYPDLQDAIHDGTYEYGSGLYHDYCGHFQSTYIPGISPKTSLTDDANERRILEEMGESEGNRFIYQTRQTQRDIEYQIRKYKRRKSVAMDERERTRMNKRVQFWQAKQREHVSQHSFLKRNYAREAA